MALTHVCKWDSENGYRRITVEEAAKIYPERGISASSGYFICELCAQNVCFTAPGKNIRHFRHDSAAQNKFCEERQQKYEYIVKSSKNSRIPIRIRVHDFGFEVQLGFFLPKNDHESLKCSEIKIHCDSDKVYRYSFERIVFGEMRYLNVGEYPSEKYTIVCEHASEALRKYWPSSVEGINRKGTFFDLSNGKMIQAGGYVLVGNSYYYLSDEKLNESEVPFGIGFQKISETKGSLNAIWFLYRIEIKSLTETVAKFLLKKSVLLEKNNIGAFVLWPPYMEKPYFLYHDSDIIYFYFKNRAKEFRTNPSVMAKWGIINDGVVCKLDVSNGESVFLQGVSGKLDFSYLIRKKFEKVKTTPEIVIEDKNRANLSLENYEKLPDSKMVRVFAKFDGKATVVRNGKIRSIHKIRADEFLTIGELTFGTKINIFQGNDLVRTVAFGRKRKLDSNSENDRILQKRLSACRGNVITLHHSMSSMIGKLSDYPLTREWILSRVRSGKISRAAYKLLVHFITRNVRRI